MALTVCGSLKRQVTCTCPGSAVAERVVWRLSGSSGSEAVKTSGLPKRPSAHPAKAASSVVKSVR